MKVYHGSIIEVAHPLVSLGRRNLDFGKGFYVTDIKEQAQRWAERMGRRKLAAPIVSIYNFEVEKARECMFLLQLFNEKHLDIYNFILHFVAKVQNLLK